MSAISEQLHRYEVFNKATQGGAGVVALRPGRRPTLSMTFPNLAEEWNARRQRKPQMPVEELWREQPFAPLV